MRPKPWALDTLIVNDAADWYDAVWVSLLHGWQGLAEVGPQMARRAGRHPVLSGILRADRKLWLDTLWASGHDIYRRQLMQKLNPDREETVRLMACDYVPTGLAPDHVLLAMGPWDVYCDDDGSWHVRDLLQPDDLEADLSGGWRIGWDGGLQLYEATTNLEDEPSFEVDPVGWACQGTNTIERSSEQAKFGNNSLKCTYNDSAQMAYAGITLSAGAHSLSVWIYIPSDYDGTLIKILFSSFTGATGTYFADADMNIRDDWQLVECPNYVIDAGDVAGYIYGAYETGAPTAGKYIYIDGVQCEALDHCTATCIGDMGPGFAWTGDPHASTSTREDAVLALDDHASDLVNPQMTFCGWWVVGTTPSDHGDPAVFCDVRGAANTDRIRFRCSADDKFDLYINEIEPVTDVGSGSLTSGDVIFWCITLDFDEDDYHVYVVENDGTLYTDSGTSSLTVPVLTTYRLGGNYLGTGGFLDGVLSDVLFLDRVMSATEIARWYNRGRGALNARWVNVLCARQDAWAPNGRPLANGLVSSLVVDGDVRWRQRDGDVAFWRVYDPLHVELEEVDDETGASWESEYHGLSLADGQAFLRVEGVDLTGYVDHLLRLYDSAGKLAYGYIQGADAAETLGGEIFANGGFENPGGGGADIWANVVESAGDGALANEVGIVHGGADSCKQTAGASTNTYVYMTAAVTAGTLCKVTIWSYGDGTHDGRYAIWDSTNGAWIIPYTATGQTTAAWGSVTVYFTAPFGCASVSVFMLCSSTNGAIVYFDDASIQEVTNVGTDGATIIDEQGGGTRNWSDIEAGFDYNDSSYTLEVLWPYSQKTVTVETDVEVYPEYRLTPTASKTTGFTYRMWQGVKWDIDALAATNYPYMFGPFDLDGKAQSDGDDIRVFVDGVEVDRWLGGTLVTAVKIWVNLDFEAPQEGTLADVIASGDTITEVASSSDISGFPVEGIFVINGEAFYYTAKNSRSRTFSGVTRATRGTSAGDHSVGDTISWVQHDIFIKYGDDELETPTADDDYKPAFNIDDSTNSSHVYDYMGEDDGLRTLQWVEGDVFTGFGVTSEVYTANHHTEADPWEELGLYVNPGGSYTLGWASWDLYNPCGIAGALFENGEFYIFQNLAYSYKRGLLQACDDGASWATEQTYNLPDTFGVWTAASDITDASINHYYIRFRLETNRTAGSIPDYTCLEYADVTITVGNPAAVTSGDEENDYSLDCTITNTTTGEAIEVTASMVVDDVLTIDTYDKAVRLDDGTLLATAVSPDSVRRDWLRLFEGDNVLTYEEVGCQGVEIAVLWHRRLLE